jgi:hypothetical protein
MANKTALTYLCIATNLQLTDVSNAHEKEFLNAYRVHMLTVQLELKDLKSR